MSLPIHINLIFVGFDGDGQNGIKIPTHLFEEWFEHVEHTIDHETIPFGDNSTKPSSFVYSSNRVFACRSNIFAPFSFERSYSRVKYRFMARIIKVSSLVNTIIENAIMYHLRAEDPEYDPKSTATTDSRINPETFYVDAFKFSSLLVSLVRHLGLGSQNGYTLFVLNPKSAINEDQKYGYRVGFSHQEIDALHGSTAFSLPPSLHSELYKRRGDEELAHQVITDDNSQQTTAPQRPVASKSVHWVDLTSQSQAWAEDYVRRIIKGPDSKQVSTSCSEEDDPLCGFKNNKDEDKNVNIVKLATRLAATGSADDKRYLYKVQNIPWMQAECLVDQWVSHSRVAFADLTAGPFEWGPILARQGAKIATSLPRITGAALEELKLEQEEEQNIHRVSDPGEVSEPTQERDFHQGKQISSKEEGEQMSRWQAIRDAALVDAKEAFAVLCAKKVGLPTPECIEMERKLKELEQEVHLWTSDRSEGGVDHAPFALDSFMSKMGAFISKTLRHLVVRPSPSFPTPYAEKIEIHLHLILGQTNYDPLAPLHFNIQEFKHEMRLMKLPGQQMAFTFRKHSIRDNSDPLLSMAVQHSFKSESVARMSINGFYNHPVVTHIDAAVLQAQFRKIFSTETSTINVQYDSTGKGYVLRSLPVFILSLDSTAHDEPILIDKYLAARGLSDMVIVVQSNQSMYETRWHCNKEAIFWNMRSPTRHALAAAALSLYGMVPPHLAVDHSTGKLVKDHMWSVGNNPFSGTSHGSHFSGFHVDTATRSAIAQSLSHAIETFNVGVDVLKTVKATPASYHGVSYLPNSELNSLRNEFFMLVEAISAHVETLDWAVAILQLRRLELTARKFRDAAKSAVALMGSFLAANLPSRCRLSINYSIFVTDVYKCLVEESVTQREARTSAWGYFFYPTAIFSYGLAMLLYFVCRDRKKAKFKLG